MGWFWGHFVEDLLQQVERVFSVSTCFQYLLYLLVVPVSRQVNQPLGALRRRLAPPGRTVLVLAFLLYLLLVSVSRQINQSLMWCSEVPPRFSSPGRTCSQCYSRTTCMSSYNYMCPHTTTMCPHCVLILLCMWLRTSTHIQWYEDT